MSSRHAAVAPAVLLVLALAAPPAGAQTADGGGLLGIGVHVSALGGPVGALAELGTTRTSGVQAFQSELDPGWSVGGAVEVPLTGGFSLRGDARALPGAEMLTKSITCPVGGVTSERDHCTARSGGSLWMATGGVVYRTESTPRMPTVFIHAGAGVKRYDFSTEPDMRGIEGDVLYTGECLTGDRVCEVHVLNGFAGEHTDVTGRVGFGLSMTVGGVRLAGELADYVSVFAPSERPTQQTVQHELFLTVEVGTQI